MPASIHVVVGVYCRCVSVCQLLAVMQHHDQKKLGQKREDPHQMCAAVGLIIRV